MERKQLENELMSFTSIVEREFNKTCGLYKNILKYYPYININDLTLTITNEKFPKILSKEIFNGNNKYYYTFTVRFNNDINNEIYEIVIPTLHLLQLEILIDIVKLTESEIATKYSDILYIFKNAMVCAYINTPGV